MRKETEFELKADKESISIKIEIETDSYEKLKSQLFYYYKMIEALKLHSISDDEM